jgi:hypothetical protein
MSKKSRKEVSEAQSDRAAFMAVASQHKRQSPPRTPEEIVQIERAERAAQDKSASYAAASWPESLAECRGRRFARLTNGDHGGAVAASKAYGFFGARLYMRGFLSALGPAPYERGQ